MTDDTPRLAQSQGQTKDNFEKAWAKRPWLNEGETDKDRAFRWWCAALALGNAAQKQSLPSDEWCNAFLRATGEWVEPYEPETECGVPIECGITQEDADQINAEAREQVRKGYAAALAPGNGAVEAKLSDETPVCPYCDHDLSCAHCGVEQPSDYEIGRAHV